mmetsp:Transcript_14392/g.43518  ORF Transcript_14392/g.43518 Transcript_14392/m.43518 type:complete len:298 (+) Transcript_14392:413-1306(+)|eukprot:CAMPEP_0206147490 /NCGR_PEP_ID=MMETSP1473-20131121/33597_1 /ASSEMBLY_ACC=CAM_ASM_001109 /TAXON_ID=1461547 /ORGANISM="Stichococcus sp, Strain RCC1054" /LENGTH=297 /DNA_ID=CAMNT_0053544437 /DNA_START=393 /DNA_END=1286 /DNA_ORIENTATION=-
MTRSRTAVISPEEAERDLVAAYARIAKMFEAHGVKEESLHDFRDRCKVEGAASWPLRYDEFQPPYPPGAVRLAILSVKMKSEMVAAIVAAVDAVLDAIPKSPQYAVYRNAPEHWHITLFHTARLGDARPDAFTPGGGINSALGGPTDQPPPTEGALEAEVAAFRRVLQPHSPVALRAYRLLMTDSGTLVLGCLDRSGQVAAMREELREALPGAPAAQTSILHITLARMAGGAAEVSTPEGRRAVDAACNSDTVKHSLAGVRFIVTEVEHVLEEIFSTVQGRRRTVIPLMGAIGREVH